MSVMNLINSSMRRTSASIPVLSNEVEEHLVDVQVLTDLFESLLRDGKFPHKGRSIDDKESYEQFFEDRYALIERVRKQIQSIRNKDVRRT